MNNKTKEYKLETIRHSAAHIMADAIKKLYPNAKLAIGPSIEDGFYYDFDGLEKFSSENLAKVEKIMKKIISSSLKFEKKEISKKEAKKLFENEPYKLELIEELEEENLTIYSHGDFVDLCKGPHIEKTSEIKAFKLLKVAGAYWRGCEKNKQLTRIYGTAFESKEKLDGYLKLLEEAEKRDHRKLGKELDLYSSMEEFGAGLILWHPKGGRVRQALENFWRAEHTKNGYEIVYTPHIARLEMWKISGHWDFYRENMYSPMIVDEMEYELKPMNCPFHIQIYKTSLKSYRELPLRMAELGTVYRYERSGVLHGLMRVRGFTQDDAHIFARPDQVEEEVKKVLDFSLYMLRSFGFKDFNLFLSTKPEKHVGTDSEWDLATSALEKALKDSNIKYEIDPGEGVFYGPKIDIKIKDSLGRQWQCTTIQVDFNLPERYKMDFVGKDGERHRPIMIHRALLGSIERFMGILIEHYAGDFPVWLAPVQATVLAISEQQNEYATKIYKQLKDSGLKIDIDNRNEKLGFKIRESELKKIPYMLIIGAKEEEENKVAVRSRKKGDLGNMPVDKLIELIHEDINSKGGALFNQDQDLGEES